MVLYGGIDYNQPINGYGDKGPAPAPAPSPGLGSGLGNLGNILLGYLNQPAAPPPQKYPGVVPPSQAIPQQPQPGQPPIVLVDDPSPGGDVGSGNNSGNTVTQNSVNIPGFGNVTFNAPNLPPLPNAQFGNSPPLSLIAQLSQAPQMGSIGGAPGYDTNVGASGSVQGAPGQMIDTKRDSPAGPAPQQGAGPLPQQITPWGEAFLSGHKPPPEMPGATAQQAPPRQMVSAGGPPGAPPMPPPGGMPPVEPQAPGGAGATESNNAVFERLKKKMQKMYQDGAITPEEMNALNGMATSSAPPQAAPTQGYGDAFTSQKTVGEVANAAPEKPAQTGATTGGALTPQEEADAANKGPLQRSEADPLGYADLNRRNAASRKKEAIERERQKSEPSQPEPEPPPQEQPKAPAIQEQFPQSEPPVHQPASSATAERPYHAPYQAGATRRDRDEEIQDLSASLKQRHAELDPRKVMTAYQEFYADKAQHPSGTGKPILDGIVRLHNRLNFGNQANAAQYRAQQAANAYLNGPVYHQQKEEYGRDYNRLNALMKERDDESQAAEKQTHTEQLAAQIAKQKQEHDDRADALKEQRTALYKHLAVTPPSPITRGMIDRAGAAGVIPDDEGTKSRLHQDSYDQEAAQKHALETQKDQLAIQKEKQEMAQNQNVRYPKQKMQYEAAKDLLPTKAESQKLANMERQLNITKKQYELGHLDENQIMKMRKDEQYLANSKSSIEFRKILAAQGEETALQNRLRLPGQITVGGSYDPATYGTEGITDPTEQAAAVTANQKRIGGELKRGELLGQRTSSLREKFINVHPVTVQAVQKNATSYLDGMQAGVSAGVISLSDANLALKARGLPPLKGGK